MVHLTNWLKQAERLRQKWLAAKRLRAIKRLLRHHRNEILESAFAVRKQRPRAVEKLMSHTQRQNPSYTGLSADEEVARNILEEILDQYDDIQIGSRNNRIYLFQGDRGLSLRLDTLEFDTFLDKQLPLNIK